MDCGGAKTAFYGEYGDARKRAHELAKSANEKCYITETDGAGGGIPCGYEDPAEDEPYRTAGRAR